MYENLAVLALFAVVFSAVAGKVERGTVTGLSLANSNFKLPLATEIVRGNVCPSDSC